MEWKSAKIIPLKKPGKADLTELGAFRPISLLPTLSKAMESVIAERIVYLAEKFGLLPSNHYGALKRKSTIDRKKSIRPGGTKKFCHWLLLILKVLLIASQQMF